MQVTVTIPDEIVAQLVAHGVSPEFYIEQLVAQKMTVCPMQPDQTKKLALLETFFAEMAADSAQIPLLPDTAFTRESMYEHHD